MAAPVRVLTFVVAALAAAALGHLFVTAAVAHERRVVGDYIVQVGFRDEPPIARFPNALEVSVTRVGTGEPVTGLEQTLRVELVSADGDVRKELALFPSGREAGRYASEGFILGQPGKLAFRLFGRIGEQPVNLTFVSEEVEDPAELQFPAGREAAGTGGNGLALTLGAAGLALGLLGAGAGTYALLVARRRLG